MNIVRLEDGSIGFVDKRRVSKVFGAFFLLIGALPVPGVVSAVVNGMEGVHPVALAIGSVMMIGALLLGFCFVVNWHETWVMAGSKRVQISGRFGFRRTNKIWDVADGGAIRPWVKCTNYTNLVTAGLSLETQGESFEIFSGTEVALPQAMQLGPHLAQLLDIPFEKLETIPEVQIYPAADKIPEEADPTHFYEELANQSGYFAVGFGLLLLLCWLTDPTNLILMAMTWLPAIVLLYLGIGLLRKFSQLKIDVEKKTMNFRWRSLSKLHTEDLPIDALAAVMVTYFRSDNHNHSTYYATLYFGDHTMPLFSALSGESSLKEVQEKAWALAEQFGCSMIVALGRELDATEKISVSTK